MCLAVPGKLEEIISRDESMILGRVSFGGIKKEVNLTLVPDVKVGDYVIVHVGFALSKLDEEEALRVFQYLNEIGEANEVSG